jgi:pimeloyl-ACP methyl ester carboxylesterase
MRGVVALSFVGLVGSCTAEPPLDSTAATWDGGSGISEVDGGADTDDFENTDSGAPAAHGPGQMRAPDADSEVGSAPPVDESVMQQVASALEVEFTECTLFTGAGGDETTDGDGGIAAPPDWAECALIELPLRWSEPQGEPIQLFIKRIPAVEPSRGQLWLLEGGPGSSGAGLEWLAADLHEAVPDLDIYIPDHRGVGRSTFFECETAQSVFPGGEQRILECGREVTREWGEATHEFRTTAAARDVLAAATALHTPNTEVIVWGSSYGAFWAHRVMQVDQAARLLTAVVMDSPALPIGGKSTLESAHTSFEAGETLLDQCATDATCSERLGPDPQARALSILDGLCNEFAQRRGRAGLQGVLTMALRSWQLLRLIPAALFRAERCAPEDIEFLDNYAALIPNGGRENILDAPNSEALYLNVMFSEYLTELSPRADVEQHSESVVFSRAWLSPDYHAALADWPLYERDEYMGRWADSDIPVLTLYGALDTNTAPSEGVLTAEHFSAPGQHGFLLPTGGHGVYYRSHDLLGDSDASCGKHLTVQFLQDPDDTIDASCLDDAEPLDFSASEELLLEIAGHTDVWDNP